MTTPSSLSAELALVARIPDQTLDEILGAIRQGARTPAEAMGFGAPAMNAVEQAAAGNYRARRYADAAVLYGFLLRLDLGRASAWRGLGACAHALNDYEKAVKCYATAVEYDPGDVPAKVFWGEALCALGQRDRGVEILNAVIGAGTRNPSFVPYVTRARAIVGAKGGVPPRLVLMREGRRIVEEATEALAAAPGFQPDPSRPMRVEDVLANPQLKPLLAELSQAVGDGRLTLAQVGGFTANELQGAYAVGCRYAETGQVLQALQIAGFLMFLDSRDARFPQLIAICLQRMKQYGPADHFYSLSLALDGANPMSLVYRGECKIMAGDVDGGLALVRQGVDAAGMRKEHRDLLARGQVLLKQFARD